jgi:hypothetical protein
MSRYATTLSAVVPAAPAAAPRSSHPIALVRGRRLPNEVRDMAG